MDTSERQAGAEIEITPARAAGLNVLFYYDHEHDDWDRFMAEIYSAMRRAEISPEREV